ncbi:phage baseplate assembly protein V [Candidatus Poribacteria bacterium]|nr:phage baseplate assembly protein V [Candidatus Poribacteria bacterium]
MPNPIEERDRRLSELEKKVENLLRIAQVAVVHETEALVDVRFDNDLLIERIPFMTMRAGEDQTYWLPSVGELGFLLAPSGDVGNSVFLPAIFYRRYPAKESSLELHKRFYRDGTEEEVNVGSHKHKLKVGDSDNYRRETNETEIKDTFETSHIKQNANETEIKRTSGKVIINMGTTTKIEVTPTAINVELSPTVKIAMSASSVVLTSPVFNVKAGAFQWNGVPTTPIAWVATS